jgi:peroxiredoxin
MGALIESSVKIGERLPAFVLAAQDGTKRELPLEKPTVLVFFRGQWCPYCRWELTGLQTINRAVLDLGGEIIGVSPDTGAESEELRERLSLAFPILSDPDLAVTDAFGLRHAGGRSATGEDKPFPTTFIVDAEGIVRTRLENESHRERPSPKDVFAALKAVAPLSSQPTA